MKGSVFIRILTSLIQEVNPQLLDSPLQDSVDTFMRV